MEKVPITRAGRERIEAELLRLRRVVRPLVIEELSEARRYAGRADNHLFRAALERHTALQRRIGELEERLGRCEVVVGRKFHRSEVGFGSVVTVESAETGEVLEYEMVGPWDSDVALGRLSVESPVGRALVGCRPGEAVTVMTPGGSRTYRVVSVEP